jgi:hypothetical protein
VKRETAKIAQRRGGIAERIWRKETQDATRETTPSGLRASRVAHPEARREERRGIPRFADCARNDVVVEIVPRWAQPRNDATKERVAAHECCGAPPGYQRYVWMARVIIVWGSWVGFYFEENEFVGVPLVAIGCVGSVIAKAGSVLDEGFRFGAAFDEVVDGTLA